MERAAPCLCFVGLAEALLVARFLFARLVVRCSVCVACAVRVSPTLPNEHKVSKTKNETKNEMKTTARRTFVETVVFRADVFVPFFILGSLEFSDVIHFLVSCFFLCLEFSRPRVSFFL